MNYLFVSEIMVQEVFVYRSGANILLSGKCLSLSVHVQFSCFIIGAIITSVEGTEGAAGSGIS